MNNEFQENFEQQKLKSIKTIVQNQIGQSNLDLSDLYLANNGLKFALEIIEDNQQSISALLLRGNKLTAECLQYIGQFIKRNDTVQTLSLEWNQINDNEKLGQFFLYLENSNLRILDLRSNKIDQMFGQAIQNFLMLNTNIETLDLRWNQLTNQTGLQILDMLKKKQPKILQYIKLDGNGIDKSILDQIDLILEKNRNDIQIQEVSLVMKQSFDEEKIDQQKLGIVNECIVGVLKEDLIIQKENNRSLEKKVNLLKQKEQVDQYQIEQTQYQNKFYQKQLDDLKEENYQLKQKLKQTELQSEQKIHELEQQIKNFRIILQQKEEENSNEIQKIANMTSQKIQQLTQEWESWQFKKFIIIVQ